MNEKIRFNNIGVEKIQQLGDSKPSNTKSGLAIVKYHPNQYFGMLDGYLQEGWIDEGEYITYRNVKLNKDCFEHIEDNYVLAFVYLQEGEDETTLESVGDRPLFIEENEREDFFKSYQAANHKLINS